MGRCQAMSGDIRSEGASDHRCLAGASEDLMTVLKAVSGCSEMCPLKAVLEKLGGKDEVGRDGVTALHLAAMHGYDVLIPLFLVSGISPNAVNNAGWTPLHEAVSNGHFKIAKLLLQAGSNCNLASVDGTSPLHLAAAKGHGNLVELLLLSQNRHLWAQIM